MLARLASRAHGVVTRAQLLHAGITAREIQRRLGKGALLPVHRGVYRVGHRAPSIEARYMAAVLACGKEAVLSGPAAAWLLGILKGPPPGPEVTSPGKHLVARVTVRRSATQRDCTVWRGIPVTSVARTLTDLAAALDEQDLARACHEAGVRHHTTPAQVEAVLARRPNSPGAVKLRAILRGDTRVTLSKLERRFLHLLEEHGLPLPQTNRIAGRRRVDCRWAARRLTVELDGYRYHHSRHAWEQDRRREREARARGDEFRRYTYGDVFEQPAALLTELHVLLAAAVPPGNGDDPAGRDR